VKHTTIPYTPEQINVIERENQTFVESVQCMLQQMKLDNILWVKAMATIILYSKSNPYEVNF
jgi:hypothetical protein